MCVSDLDDFELAMKFEHIRHDCAMLWSKISELRIHRPAVAGKDNLEFVPQSRVHRPVPLEAPGPWNLLKICAVENDPSLQTRT